MQAAVMKKLLLATWMMLIISHCLISIDRFDLTIYTNASREPQQHPVAASDVPTQVPSL